MADPYLTAPEARALSPVLTKAFPAPAGDDALTEALLYASVLVGSMTCRSLVTDQPGEAVPAYLDPIADRAVVLKAEQGYIRGGTLRSRTRSVGAGNLASISAGPWSESYFGPEKAMSAKMLDPDPTTHEALWALATEDCRAAWLDLWADRPAPAAALQSFEWGARPGNYGYGGILSDIPLY